MDYSNHNQTINFPKRAVSVKQAIKVLKQNGIETTDEQAKIILNFLYLLAKVGKPCDYLDQQ
jgi:hypothetical protein